MSKAIAVSTGPIFTIVSANGRNLREFSRSGPVFPIAQGTWQPIFWQNRGKITYALHLSFRHSEMEWDIGTSMCSLTAQMMALYRVKTS